MRHPNKVNMVGTILRIIVAVIAIIMAFSGANIAAVTPSPQSASATPIAAPSQ